MAAREGLIILDLSEIQDRRPNPEGREISRLRWSNITVPQVPIPVTIGGKPYVVEVDEYATGPDGGQVTGNGERVGAARIIDISDETRPFVVSNIRLEVHQPENRGQLAGDYGARSPVQGCCTCTSQRPLDSARGSLSEKRSSLFGRIVAWNAARREPARKAFRTK